MDTKFLTPQQRFPVFLVIYQSDPFKGVGDRGFRLDTEHPLNFFNLETLQRTNPC